MSKIFIFLLIISPLPVLAQRDLPGLITDFDGSKIDGATVVLERNGTAIKSLIADKGVFAFSQITDGSYTLSVNMVGYNTVKRQILLPKDSLLIILQPKVSSLKEVNVTSKKPLIERKIDRVVFNVENSVIASGGTLWDALNKAPGVQTKADGGITANSKSVTIYLDDRPVRLSGEDLGNYLKSLPSDKVSKIEIITNPPAKYDAQGGAIINIVSKKTLTEGLNLILGSTFTQATFSSYTGSAVFNYRSGNINIYGNYGYSRRKREHDENDYVIFQNPGSYSYWDGVNKGDRGGTSHSFQLGTDYNITKNQLIGFIINGYYGNNTRHNHAETNIFNNHNPIADSALNTVSNTFGHSVQYSYNINYKTKLDTLGQTLNIDIDYVPFRNKNDQVVNSTTLLNTGGLSATPYSTGSLSDQDINIWSAKLDYSKRIFKKINFDAGLKYTNIDTRNNFQFFNEDGPTPVLQPSQSDNFEYQEKTSAGYLNINGSLHKLSYQLGLRGEQTDTRGYSIVLDSLNKNNYFRIFPSLYLTYSWSKNDDFSLVYNSRINRPDYSRLNPFKYYTSPYNFFEGNPALKPAYINNVELGYTYKKQYNFTLYYRRTTDYFSNITVQDNVNKIFYNTQQNLDLSLETGFFVSVPISVTNWWDMNNFIQGSYKKEKSGYLDGSYNYHTLSLYLNTNQAFVLNKKAGLKAEISAWYSSPSIQGIYKLARTYDVSIGIRKTIFDGHGAVRIAAGDLFYGNAYRINVNYLNQQNGFYEKNDTRNVYAGISYKIGSKKIADARKRKTATEDEKKRAYN